VKHDLHLRGFAFGLRPITLEDAEFILELRADRQRSRFLHPIALSVEAQRAYLEEYFKREDDYYFVVERQRENSREGLAAIYNVDAQKRSAEWGRWILRPGSLASAESALRIYEAAFDYLHLEEVHCHTISENRAVVSFHDRCGLTRRATLPRYFTIDQMTYDAVEHVLTRQNWPRVRQSMEPIAKMIGERLQDRS
jgi:RimJ/RimL family protein N-acetyltransferase